MDEFVPRNPGRQPAPPHLVDALLDTVGLGGAWRVESVAEVGWINRNTVIRLADGERLVVRVYRWPFEATILYDRAAKEAWLHPQLAGAGVPVAEVLAVTGEGAERAALLTWLPGETLGVVAQRVDPESLADAWFEAGAALARAHALEPLGAEPGWLDAGPISMPGGSFGAFHEHGIAEHAKEVDRLHPGFDVDPSALAELATRACPVVDAVPLVLGHSDSHPWNVLVAPDEQGRWHLSGWLDWEFAWLGDAAWDHMRVTLQRFAPIGPTPAAWWDGYGSRPAEVNLAVAILHFMLWKAVDPVDTRDRAIALAWLVDLPTHLERLDRLLR